MQIDWGFYYFMKAVEWLNPLVHLIGFGVSILASKISRMSRYAIIAGYCLLVVFSLTVGPTVRNWIYERMEGRDGITQEAREGFTRESVALEEKYFPSHLPRRARAIIRFPLDPIILVLGLWTLARCEARQRAERMGSLNAR
jgi:hypothetical protein